MAASRPSTMRKASRSPTMSRERLAGGTIVDSPGVNFEALGTLVSRVPMIGDFGYGTGNV